MGGCRCTFRDCSNNSSNSPGMHFFHFPYKNLERCRKWALYSGNMDFLDLETSKLRNKVVCETHFRDENFMNYKRDRIVHHAIPTLVRLEGGNVLDYEEGNDPAPKFLPPSTLQHLLPPLQKKIEIEPYLAHSHEEEYETSAEVCSPPPLKKPHIEAPRILNVAAPKNHLLNGKIGTTVLKVKNDHAGPTFTLEPVVDCDEVEVDFNVIEDTSLRTLDEVGDTSEEERREDLVQCVREIETLNAELAAKDSQIASMQTEIQTLVKEQMALLETKPVAMKTQVETITTSIKSEAGSSTPLTKTQLFNGIKKYLSPSMAALVRMEMFGGPERDWKPDEKNVSVELLNLGEQVFDFIRDEWRCRLPPKRDVQQWLSQRDTIVEEEEL